MPSNRTVDAAEDERESRWRPRAKSRGHSKPAKREPWPECCERRLAAVGARTSQLPSTLLLVEPDPSEARQIAALLSGRTDLGQSLHSVDTLRGARERLKRGDIDVVLVDLDLPDSQGLSTLDAIVRECPRVAIVVLGGTEEADLGAAAVRQGAQDYLRKSQLQPELLHHALRYAHERKALENEHAQVERELGLIGRLTRMSAQAETFDGALEELLEEVCLTTGWIAAESWIPSVSGDRLIRGPTFNAGGEAIDGFHDACATLELGPGEGLAGDVWMTRAATWAEDVQAAPAFCRSELAALSKIRSVLMVPVLSGDEVAAVLGFFHTRGRPRDDRLIDFLTAAAAQLGAVLQRRRAEEALRRSESRMRQLMDTANDGICVLGAEGEIRYMNERGATMLGSTSAALLGAPARTVFGAEVVSSPTTRPLGRSRLYRETRELHVDRAGGGDLWVMVSTSPIYGSAGILDGWLLMLTDITALKRTEQGERILAEFGRASGSTLDAAATLETIVRAIEPEMAESCAVLTVENEELRLAAGAATNERVDRIFREAIATRVRMRPKPGGVLASALETSETLTSTHPELDGIQAVIPSADEDFLGVLERTASLVVPIATRAGVPGLIVIGGPRGDGAAGRHLMTLATELGRRAGLALENARLYQQAKAAIRARDEFLGVVAHDLRNPLGAVSMYATMIGEGIGSEEDRRNWSAAIRRSAEHMNRLIQDLLDVTRIEAGTLRIEKMPAPIGGILHEVVEMFANEAEKQQVEIRNELSQAVRIDAAVDRTRMIQVLSNLVGNALKFTPAGGTITIGVEEGDDEIRFEVRDTGRGIAPEAVERVFDRFYQAPDAPKSGAGLGLTIAHGIVKAHGGRIWAESTLGSGTTFRFTIPKNSIVGDGSAAPAAAPAPVPVEVAPAGPPRRVLIADDHEIFRRSLEELLNATGRFEIVGDADSGEKAVEQARQLRPDMVVMDLDMPGRGGLWATEQIAALPGPVPVLVLTGDTHDEMILRAMEVGASGYVRKHVEPDALLDAIDAVARGELGVDARANRLLAERYRQKRHEEAESPLADLTEPERMIVQLAAAGYNSREIGKQLYLSSKTVDTYRSKLMRRLGLRHRSDLVHFAIKHGLLRAEAE